jgi:(2Fe-2S) ferredoxin
LLAIGVNPYTAHDTAPPPRGGIFRQIQEVPSQAAHGTSTEGEISKKKAKKARALAAPPHTRPGAKVREHDAHVLICGSGDCKKRGSKEVRKALKEELRGRSMMGDVRVDSVGCLGLCKHGPNAVVYPGGTWYLGLTERDMPEIVGRHLEGGEPVEHLAAELRPRKKKRK